MRISVDPERCTLNAVCMSEAPDVFEVDDEGLNILVEEPGEDLRESVENAVDMCPTMALTITA